MFRCLRPGLIEIQPGEVHGWQLAEARSKATHDHFFACINDAWLNLPEELADDFPSAEHLRKWALIKAGFCTMTTVVCATNADALTLAARARELDRYAMAEVVADEKSPLKSRRIVRIWTADSQRRDAMGRKVFQEAKERALQVISELIGTDITTLKKEAGNGA